MIVRLVHVQCDQCQVVAVPEGESVRAATVTSARALAAGLGFRQHEIAAGPLAGLKLDLCEDCQRKAGIIR